MLPPRRRFTSLEKRRNAEREWVRSNWLSEPEMGLRMAHQLRQHDEEMRWLAELFPEERKVSCEDATKRLSEWCAAHPDDARALVHLADVQSDDVLMEKAAAMGDARAMAELFFSSSCEEKKFELACASARKGDADGTYRLMECFRRGIGCERNDSLAEELLVRAADLGCFGAYFDIVRNACLEPAERAKHLIGFFGMYKFGSSRFCADLCAVFLSRAADGSCADAVLFDAGEMLKGNIDVQAGTVFGRNGDSEHLEMLLQAVALYDRWCGVAREACVMWVLTAKRMGVNKDVRRMIAGMVWETRREER